MELTWDEISRKLTEAADYTVKKTEQLTAIAKLEYKLSNAKNKLNQLYAHMGKMKFSEMTGETVDAKAYQAVYDKITAMLLLIEELEEKLAKLRNWRFCIGCGGKIGADMTFCPKCGIRQTPAATEEEAVLPEALPEKAPEVDAETVIAEQAE